MKLRTMKNDHTAENAVQRPVVIGIKFRPLGMCVGTNGKHILAATLNKWRNIQLVGIE